MDAIIEANHLCNLLGIDTISMGVTLSFVAECMERGIICETEIDGRVGFSEPHALSELIRKTARVEGIGVHLSLGSTRIAERFGGNAPKFLHAVKGMEMPGHSARGLRGMSLGYAVSTRGGTHHDGRPNYLTLDPDPGFEPQPELLVKVNAHTAVGDSLVICRFTGERGLGIPLNEDVAGVVRSVTGWDMALGELEKIGERIYNLERLINVMRGVNRKADTLPYRVMNEPIPEGPQSGRCCTSHDLDRMLDRYYALMGWTSEGIPTEEKLSELGLR
jgi:aldehyde:ferredoxin oxidoreductase